MDKVRKDIVLKEIRYWKEHRLLPEHYCDFLLSLYTEGSATEQQIYEKKSRAFSFKKIFSQLSYIYLLLQLLFTIVIIYFTEISIVLQIAFFTFFVFVSVGSTIYYYRKRHLFFHAALILGILILFLASAHIFSILSGGTQVALVVVILTNCLLWTVVGYKLNLKYLIISGIAGALVLIFYIIF